MTTKHLTGVYPGGYALSSAYTGLVIEATASVGGAGVSASSSATIENDGTVHATTGKASGIYLKAGGTLTNGSATDTTASIAGFYGVLAFGSSAITNYGAIQGASVGVALAAGGTLTNGSAADATASISGSAGVSAGYPSAMIANFGTIQGSHVGVTLAAGGTVTNGSADDTTALIAGTGAGPLFGVAAQGSAMVVNFGTIRATAGKYSPGGSLAVYLGAGGSVTNGSASDTTALIAGPGGVYAAGPTAATVTNFGTIQGTGGAAVTFKSAADRLIVENGAAFVGALAGGGGTLELAGGADTITGLGSSGAMTGATSAAFSGFGSYVVDAGASLTLTGTDALTTNQSLTVAGSLTNTGTLTAPTAGGAAVNLSAGGGVTNGSAGDTTALIVSQVNGIVADGAGATIANFGTIQGTGGYGVYLRLGGTVKNGSAIDTSALIEGSRGVYARRSSTTIANFGTIQAVGTGFRSVGVSLTAGGGVTNGSDGDTSALISGPELGVYIGGGLGTIANFGTIQCLYGDAVFLPAGGTVTNGSASDTQALINGSEGVSGASAIFNFGTIQGAGGAGVFQQSGKVTNGSATDASALITGNYGVFFAGASSTIANYGTVQGSAYYGVVLNGGGTVSNGSAGDTSALIAGPGGVDAAGKLVTIGNFGTIQGLGSGNSGVRLTAGGTVTNGSSTDTTALIEGFYGVRASGKSATIANFGTIQGASRYGVGLMAGGSVTNGSATDASARIEGDSGISASGASTTIANFGTIQASAPGGYGIRLGAGGTVTNGSAADTTALIQGSSGVFAQSGSATIANFGTIQAGNAGVSLSAGGTATNGSAADTTALIAGGPYGIAASGLAATIVNYGAIQGGNAGVSLSAGGTVTNGSAGDTTALIAGGPYGIAASGLAATIANYGAIQGGTDGVWLQAGGAVTNGTATDTTASIAGFATGVLAAGGPATVANYGTVRGTVAYGVSLAAGGTVTNGSAADTSALVAGFHSGVNARGASAAVVNFGTIQATAHFGTGVYLYAGGTVTNGSAGDTGALIMAARGVYAGAVGAVKVTNFGTISGTGGTAVLFESSSDVLVVEAGCAFQGAVLGGGGRLNLASGVGTISDLTGGNVTVSGSMATTTFTNFGTLNIGPTAQFTLTGTGAIGSGGTNTLVDNGAFTVTGALVVAGTVKGTGTFSQAGGPMTVNAGGAIGVAHWSLTGGTCTINESLTYKGVFNEGAGATLALGAGDKLVLAGAATLGGTIDGPGTVKVSNATVGGLTVGGAARLDDLGTVDQTGAVTLGDGASKAILQIVAGATWAIDNDSGIAGGTSTSSSIKNSGTLIKSGGTGVSVIGVKVKDTGSMEAASGTLDFTKALTGTGTMTVDAGATLEVDSTAAATLSTNFNGGNAVLALKDPSRFAATINGFVHTDTIDLMGRKATSATLGAGDTLVITNGTKAVATLQLAGDYTGNTFTVSSDGNGGTNITVTPGPAHGVASPAPLVQAVASGTGHHFIAAMAGFGGDSHGPVSVLSEAHSVHPGMLSAPRMAMA